MSNNLPSTKHMRPTDYTMPQVELGSTGIKVSRVGMGILPIGPNQLALPLDEGASIINYAIDRGINFIDTAQYYDTNTYIRRALDLRTASALDGAALDSRPVVICSKSLAEDYDGMMSAIEESCRQLNRDKIDIFLMHEVRSGQLADRAGAWEALVRARHDGLVGAIGLSTHHVDVTLAASQMDDLDVVFPLINYAGLGIRCGDRFATADEMLNAIKACRAAGKGIFSMKTFGGGPLTSHYRQALDFAFAQPEIDAVMLGFGNTSEIDDLIAYLSGSMPVDYNPDISHKHVHINQEDCEGCGACKNACPAGAIFWSAETGLAEVDQTKCLTCGYCSPVCPVRAVIMY